MLRAVTHLDGWSEADRDAALEWQAEQDRKCSGCGLPLDETTSPEAEDLFDAELWKCHSCAPAARRLELHRRDGGDLAGMQARIIRRPPIDDHDPDC